MLAVVASAAWLLAVVTGCSDSGADRVLDTRTPTTALAPTGSSSAVSGPSAKASGGSSGTAPGSVSTTATRSGAGSGSPSRPTRSAAAGTGRITGTGTGTKGWWRPPAGLSWQVQYAGTLDTSVAAQVYDVDGAGTSAATVARLHAAGRKVICYVDVGSSESYRSDAGVLPAPVLGNVMDGWPDERWLDIRQLSVILPVMAARFDECRAKGFDAVDPDNLEGYANDSGFPLTAADQLAFNRAIADLAHRRGLAVGLKNDVAQLSALAASFDFAVNEQCVAYSECAGYRAFTAAGKPVYSIEYTGTPATVCPVALRYGLTTLIKDLTLDAVRHAC